MKTPIFISLGLLLTHSALACQFNVPTIGINPGYQTVSIGQTGSIELYVQNHDSADCDPAQLQVSATELNEMPLAVSPTTVTVKPGQQATAYLFFMAVPGTFKGQHLIHVEANNQDHSGFSSAVVEVK